MLLFCALKFKEVVVRSTTYVGVLFFSIFLLVWECLSIEGKYVVGKMTADSLDDAILAFQHDCNPRSGDYLGDWDDGECYETIEELYNFDLNGCLESFNAAVGDAGHCSIAAITHVYALKNQKFNFAVETFEELFVSGAQSARQNGVYARIQISDGAVDGFKSAIAFPAPMPIANSHSERAVVSFFTNIELLARERIKANPDCVMVHIKNIRPSCSTCYRSMMEDRAEKRKVGGEWYFTGGKGLADVFSDRRYLSIKNSGVMPCDIPEIPVVVGVGHNYDTGGIVNLDWFRRY
jgi:hypothetical protein